MCKEIQLFKEVVTGTVSRAAETPSAKTLCLAFDLYSRSFQKPPIPTADASAGFRATDLTGCSLPTWLQLQGQGGGEMLLQE